LKYITFGIVVVVFLVYVYLDMQRIAVRRYTFKAKDSLKVMQFSDLHKKTFRRDNLPLLEIVQRERPDVLVFTGDLVSRDQEDFSQILNLMEKLCRLTRVYYTMGNHEIDMPTATYQTLCETFNGYGATLLDNQSTKVAEHTQLWGLTLPLKCYHDGNHHYHQLYYYTHLDIQADLGTPNPNDYNLLLAHNPFFFESYTTWGADLTLCGHVHGGIVRLPYVGGILSPERKLLPKYCGGVYVSKGGSMVVSRGLGKLRLFNPPEVCIITLQAG
jgi:predicted MPP superfamily phosphohydrolase